MESFFIIFFYDRGKQQLYDDTYIVNFDNINQPMGCLDQKYLPEAKPTCMTHIPQQPCPFSIKNNKSKYNRGVCFAMNFWNIINY